LEINWRKKIGGIGERKSTGKGYLSFNPEEGAKGGGRMSSNSYSSSNKGDAIPPRDYQWEKRKKAPPLGGKGDEMSRVSSLNGKGAKRKRDDQQEVPGRYN